VAAGVPRSPPPSSPFGLPPRGLTPTSEVSARSGQVQTRPSTLRGAFRVATVASILLTVWPGSSLAAYAPTGPVLRIATSPAIPHFLLPYMITTEIVGGTITIHTPKSGHHGQEMGRPDPVLYRNPHFPTRLHHGRPLPLQRPTAIRI